MHFNVTDHPTAAWAAQQVVEAFPEDTVLRFLLRDRDQSFAEEFRRRVKAMQSLIKKQPNATLKELCERMQKESGFAASVSSLSRALRWLHITKNQKFELSP